MRKPGERENGNRQGRRAAGAVGGGPGAVRPASVMGLSEDEPVPEVSWLCMGRRACHLVVAGPAPMKRRPGMGEETEGNPLPSDAQS